MGGICAQYWALRTCSKKVTHAYAGQSPIPIWRIIESVPTPFYHLSIAQELLHHPDLPPQISAFLQQNQCAFALGKTAPDVQTITGDKRENTHFFRVPPLTKKPAWQVLFSRYPQLAVAADLGAEYAAFMAGYICHLQADQLWIKMIFLPYFGLKVNWQGFETRLFRHNVLRTYIDERIIQDLPDETGDCLQQVQPHSWLPFASDESLRRWRDLLAEQLQPEGNSRTAEVFAERMHVPLDDLLAVIRSEARMEEEVFSHLPRQLLVEYRHKLIQDNLELLASYLG